jgi:hypothetical protein
MPKRELKRIAKAQAVLNREKNKELQAKLLINDYGFT